MARNPRTMWTKNNKKGKELDLKGKVKEIKGRVGSRI
jgi:hypothetical protein